MSFDINLKVTSSDTKQTTVLRVPRGKILRKALLESALSPYRNENKILNCRGMGICGTCKVLIKENEQWWERRSCQIQCFHDMEIQLK
jgi:ferredoxin